MAGDPARNRLIDACVDALVPPEVPADRRANVRARFASFRDDILDDLARDLKVGRQVPASEFEIVDVGKGLYEAVGGVHALFYVGQGGVPRVLVSQGDRVFSLKTLNGARLGIRHYAGHFRASNPAEYEAAHGGPVLIPRPGATGAA
jgi:hypothetical protein